MNFKRDKELELKGTPITGLSITDFSPIGVRQINVKAPPLVVTKDTAVKFNESYTVFDKIQEEELSV